MAENDQTETEKHTGTARGMKENERNPESENHVNKETHENHAMTDHHERENERGKEGIVTKQKRGNGTELETERSQRMVTEEVEAEIDPLTDERAGNQDILKTVLPRWVNVIMLVNWSMKYTVSSRKTYYFNPQECDLALFQSAAVSIIIIMHLNMLWISPFDVGSSYH